MDVLSKKGGGHIFEGESIFEVTVLEAIYTLDEIWGQDYYNTRIHFNGLVAAPIVHG